jgi:hypothetical protein
MFHKWFAIDLKFLTYIIIFNFYLLPKYSQQESFLQRHWFVWMSIKELIYCIPVGQDHVMYIQYWKCFVVLMICGSMDIT